MAYVTAYDDRGYIRMNDYKINDGRQTVNNPVSISSIKRQGDYMSRQDNDKSSKLHDYKTRASTLNQQQSAIGSQHKLKPQLLLQD